MTPSSLRVAVAPSGLIVERHEIGAEGLIVHARGAPPATVCPACRSPSSSVHSRYTRSLADFPAHGRRLTIKLTARRFRCRVATCDRKIFTERFAPDTIAAHARRTSRLDLLTHGIALVLGGRPGERLANRLSMPVSADTLLRILRRRATPPPACVRVVGIDDFAWRKGQRYGTILCDLQTRQTIDLPPDREAGTVANWLAERPSIEIVCRDRGGSYREAAASGAPQALQVADRWHLLENASAAFLDIVRRHMRQLRRAISSGDINPDTLSKAEKVQWAGWQRREEMNQRVRALHGEGHGIKAIVKMTGVSRQTVRRILRGSRDDVFRSRESTLDRWTKHLETEWDSGCRNGAKLWRRLREAGFGGSSRVVSEWATRKRQATKTGAEYAEATAMTMPTSRIIARLLTTERDCNSAEALRIKVAVETALPALVAARNLLDRFRAMIAAKKPDDLDPWLAEAAGSELASFACGIEADGAAVRAAIVKTWSNGQTEGQVTKLKLVKRQMYGRGKLDLLRARLTQTS